MFGRRRRLELRAQEKPMTTDAAASVPAVPAFISYSWSSPAHEAWVLDLSVRLRASGIDVILDKWELQPGRDPIAFMEQMVTRPDVKKVLMICDRIYKEKADGREGGVGKEAQILTAEIYEKANEDKYAALITEKDANGKAFVPAYYHSKQYIDFTDSTKQEDKFQELLRWLYDKPQHKKPKLGTAPSFITEPDAPTTATTSKLKQAEHAIKTGSATAGGAITDFGDAIVDEFGSLRPDKKAEGHWDDIVVASAEAMRLAVRNLSDLVLAEARYGGSNFGRVLSIFERIGSFMFRPPTMMSYSDNDFDPYMMMGYEAFLSMIAILIRESRFDLIETALKHPYLIENRERGGGPATASFTVFCQDPGSFRQRNDRLKANKIDLYADLISETYKASFPTLREIMQADLLLFIRSHLAAESSGWDRWWPRTILYWGSYDPANLFARSESISFFASWAPKVFGPISIADFTAKVTALNQESRLSWGRGAMGPNISRIANLEYLGTKP